MGSLLTWAGVSSIQFANLQIADSCCHLRTERQTSSPNIRAPDSWKRTSRQRSSPEAALAVGWNYSVVTGWRKHVVTMVDELWAGRRDLTDQLGLQDQLLRAAASGPIPFGDLVDRCSYPVIGRAHALHLLWHRRLGVEMSAPLADASLVRLAADSSRLGGAW
ncbi:hypothetical protein OG426_08715 [Streptomyces canus]|uniref:hypothetical protein n=1 Tax=Streptomyces canus TaxID=58343 RepID=UPI00386B56EC|nr:hypothetical protein OG426_08715 [Streptomyces canus]